MPKTKKIPNELNYIEIEDIELKIARSNSVKYIGLILDEKLSFNEHVSALIKSVTRFFGIFKNVKENISFKLARQLYFSFIYSRLNYGIEVYGNCSNTLLNKLQVVQNRLLKFLFGKHYLTNTNELHNEINILKLSDLRKLSITKIVHDCLNDKLPTSFNNYFKYKSGRTTRQSCDLDPPFSRLAIGQSRVAYTGCQIWNTIDHSISSLPNKKHFQKTLTKHYISQYALN